MSRMQKNDTSRWHQKNYSKDMRMKRDSLRVHNDTSRMNKMPLDKQPVKLTALLLKVIF